MYIEMNENIEKLSRLMHIALVMGTIIGLCAATLIMTAINYFVNDLEEESYYLPFPVLYVAITIPNVNKKGTTNIILTHVKSLFRLPFNWKTPFGYAIALGGFFAALVGTLFEGSATMSFKVGSCWMIITFVKDLKNDLTLLTATDMHNINYGQLKEHFCNVMRQFCVLKQLSGI